ncbi:restriction endonuclease subunit S [Bifidobacterium pseudolongum]|uniref:restriction endonuclease subunit S n=3 Tax=Bifidobacterium pseudolongum TaxID=1694 RepID=UPI0013EAC706|nr:restriction endonuclease subunit S [Bifidobacterium pseudolongum]
MSDYITDGKGRNTMVKKLQPKLRFRGFTDAWEPRRLKSLHRQPLLVSPVPSQTYISWSVPAFSTGEPEIVKGSEIESVKQSVNSSDVLLCRINPRINRVWVVEARKDTDLPMIASTEWVVFTGHNSDSYFLSALFTSSRFRNMLLSEVAGVTGSQKRFQIASVLERQEYFPTQIEQARIGLLFAKVDNLIAAEKRKLDLLQKKKTALLRQIFERKLRFKGYDNPWNRHKLGSITDSYSGGTPPVSDSSYYGGDIPFIRSAEIANESTELFITQSGLAASSAKRVKKGDVLYALYGANSGNASFAKLDGAINQAVLSIRAEKGFSNSFIMYWLQRSKNAIIGTFLQGGQGNLSGSIVKKLSIQTPRIDEQERIGLFFIKIDSLITAETRKLDLLIDKKKALLQKMFV